MITIAVISFSNQYYRRFLEDCYALSKDVRIVQILTLEDARKQGRKPDIIMQTYRAQENPYYREIRKYWQV